LPGFGVELIEDISEKGELRQTLDEQGDMIDHFCLISENIEEDVKTLQNRGIEVSGKIKTGLRGKKIAMDFDV